MQYHTMPCNTMQYHTMPYNAIQCHAYHKTPNHGSKSRKRRHHRNKSKTPLHKPKRFSLSIIHIFQLFFFLKLSIELCQRPATALHLGKSLRGPMALLSRYPGLACYKGSYNFMFAFAWRKWERLKEDFTWLDVCIASTYTPSVLDITCSRKCREDILRKVPGLDVARINHLNIECVEIFD